MSGPQQLARSGVETSRKLLHIYQTDGPPAPPLALSYFSLCFVGQNAASASAAWALFHPDELAAAAEESVVYKRGCRRQHEPSAQSESSDGAPQDPPPDEKPAFRVGFVQREHSQAHRFWGGGWFRVGPAGRSHTHRAHLLRTKAGMALGGQLGVGRGRIMTYGNASGLQGPAE